MASNHWARTRPLEVKYLSDAVAAAVINKNQSEIDVKFTKMGLTRYTGDGYHNTDVTCPEICRV